MARKQNGTFKVVHTIDLGQYKDLIEDLESTLNMNITYGNTLSPFLIQQILDIKGTLRRLSPSNVKRSIDFIGSAWKWIAGTPDKHDFEILAQKMTNLIENNNRQMLINQLTTKRMQEISDITNEIVKVKKENSNVELITKVEHKLSLIEKELQNIEYAIQWAKVNIVNSFIFSKTEIEVLNDILRSYNIPTFSVDELLTFGSVKIVTNNKEILYILSIPITQKDLCETYLVKPVKFNNLVDKIEFDKILNCNNVLFGIKNFCKEYNELTICNENSIVKLREDYCITNLFKNKIGNCTQVNNEHVPAVEEIGDDMLLLNQYNGNITAGNEEIKLNGTYLIKHVNMTITIAGHEYYSRELSGSKPLPAPLQPKTTGARTEEVLSLERLQKINVGNIKRLELLETKNNMLTIILAFIIIVTLGIFTGVKIWKKYYRQEKQLKEQTPEKVEEVPDKKEKTEKKQTSIYNLHLS